MGVYGEDTRIHASNYRWPSQLRTCHMFCIMIYQSPRAKSTHQLTKKSNNQSFPNFWVISSHFPLLDQKSTPKKLKPIISKCLQYITHKQKELKIGTPTCVGKFRLQAAVQVLNRPHKTLMDEPDLLFGCVLAFWPWRAAYREHFIVWKDFE